MSRKNKPEWRSRLSLLRCEESRATKRESCQRGWASPHTDFEAAAALSALPDSSQGETTRREDGQLLILPSESTEEAGALSSPTPNSPHRDSGSAPVSSDRLPADTKSSSTASKDRNANRNSPTISPSSGNGSESAANLKWLA